MPNSQDADLDPQLAESSARRTADVLVDVLATAGVEVVFGLPGGPISPIHDALMDRRELRVVTTRHESGAMFAAAGYAHTTGKLGVVAVTSGPGVLNAMTGLASAHCDGLPVLLLVGEVPRRVHGKGALQDGSSHGLNVVGMTRHVTKLAAEMTDPASAPLMLHRAIATALSGKRGPVVLTIPMDVSGAMVTPAQISADLGLEFTVSPRALDEVAALLAIAARPMILAGSGVRGGRAPWHLRGVAEKYQCPVATTPKAKGVFPEDHPMALGVFGLGGHPSARGYVEAGIDMLIAVGTSLGDLSTDGWTPLLQPKRAFVHVDIDARQIGRSYAPTHAMVAPAAAFLGGLLDRDPRVVSRPRAGVVRFPLPANEPDQLAPQDAVREIQAVLPRDTIFTVDSGEHFLFATHYLETTHPDAYVVMTGLGSMGQSIGGAIGAKLAHPERTVAAICGDGCFAMNGFEVATAVVERLPIVVFVFNDRRLGMVEIGHQAVFGRKPDYPISMDVGSLAAGLGARFLRVTHRGQLAEHADLLRNPDGPVIVDMHIDPDVKLPKKDRMAAMGPSGPATKPSRRMN
ncbi:MAG TPA: thiamine pyrophosphate-binding protein [Kofleriaceae bacterium]|jgi:acetolactate synthase-1/2/3 large subunit|nr:thiamine pyrophosphate-binding protein [Kofleriaceae bacterium]